MESGSSVGPAPPDGVPTAAARRPNGQYSYQQKCVVLVDWWLERMDGKICIAGLVETPQMRRKGGLFSQGSRKSAARVFKCAIARVKAGVTVETVNGYVISIKGIVNKSRMRENGFSEEVCEAFIAGFPIQWNKLIDSNIEHTDGHSQSPSNSADDAYLDELLSGSFGSSKGFSFAHNFRSFKNFASSNLREPGTKCHNTANPGTESTTEAPVTTPPCGTVQASEKREVMTLRSGRILAGPTSATIAGGKKQKRTQHKASDNKKLRTEGHYRSDF